jgi:alanine-alpha-ketoisovalerate/valine-pyruvate aminotransferase
MAGLDNVPQTQSIEIAIAKIEEDVLKSMNELNGKINLLISDFGQIYIRKKELSEELIRLDDIVERAEDEFKAANNQMKEIVDSLDETYPQGRINLKEGTIQYQPGAPTRKQQEEQQAQERQQAQSPDFKVVKE